MFRCRSLSLVSSSHRRLSVLQSIPRHLSTEPSTAPQTSHLKFRDRAPQRKSDPQRRPPPRQPRAGKDTPRRLLTPYNLALQVKQLSKDASVDDAVARVKSVPRDAQNIVVWNTLLNECMKAERWKLAYQLFTDMKRRGFAPNTNTYLTMLGGLATIKDWSNMSAQLENAHSLFDYFMKYVESVKYHDPGNLKELQSKPIAYYMKILASSGQYQRIFDVYYTLTDGPLLLDERVYTSMFNAIYHQLCHSHSSSSTPESTKQASVASDAKHVWMQMQKAHKKHSNFEIDDWVLSSALRALTRGRPSDQTFAFEIIREYLGLAKPGEEPTPGFIQKLSSRSLDAVLQLCNAAQKYRLTVHYMRQVMDAIDLSDRSKRELLDAMHFQKLLRAHVGLSSLGSASESGPALQAIEWCMQNDVIYEIPSIRPNLQVYHLLFMTCWRSADWSGALRAFELMTGRNPADATGTAYSLTVDRKKIFPDPEVMANVLRTALAAEDLSAVEQAIAITEAVGVEKLLHRKSNPFYLSRLASALLDAIRRLRDAGVATGEQNSQWRKWTTKAKEVASANRNGPTPEAEEEMLGNSRSLAATDNFVAYDMAVRSTKNLRTSS